MASTLSEISLKHDACLIALEKVVKLLQPFADDFVMVGGWVPYFLTQVDEGGLEHPGSADLDFAFDPSRITLQRRAEIFEALVRGGCKVRTLVEDIYIPMSFVMNVPFRGRRVPVAIDILGLEDPGQHVIAKRHLKLALKQSEKLKVNVGKRRFEIRVSGAAATFALKALAFGSRKNGKDAWDMFYLISFYRGGVDELAKEVRALMKGTVMRQTIQSVTHWFSSPGAIGPRSAAQFANPGGNASAQSILAGQVYAAFESFLLKVNQL
ncbi:MAG: nucleotidyl transferase AbiEii/AbiGii toxin family protein [Anaerolineae bacterium]|nr:nucleotidyl transferase AbiEii/AbiGii toxin family protein [Anaerolineae bacterium]